MNYRGASDSLSKVAPRVPAYCTLDSRKIRYGSALNPASTTDATTAPLLTLNLMTRNADDKETTEIKIQPRLPTLQSTSQGERRPALILLSGDQIATPIPLERSEGVLGRGVEADIRINDYRASRLHARVVLERSSTGGE